MRPWRWTSILLLVAAAAAADTTVSLTIGDRERSAIIHLPPAYDGERSLPVVIALHAAGADAKAMRDATRLNPMADQREFIAVYPNGSGPADHLSWACGLGVDSNDPDQLANQRQDLVFLRQLTILLTTMYKADERKIFVCGMGAGGCLAYSAAICLGDLVSAVGVVNGAIVYGWPDNDPPKTIKLPRTNGPVSVLHFADPADPYSQGYVGKDGKVYSSAESAQFMAESNGCKTPPSVAKTDDGRASTTYADGRRRSQVVLVSAPDSSGKWPADASQRLWTFFAAHGRTR